MATIHSRTPLNSKDRNHNNHDHTNNHTHAELSSSSTSSLSSSSSEAAKSSSSASSSPSPSPDPIAYTRPHSIVLEAFQLAACALGIYACFLGYGFIQERIYTRRYGPNGEKFHFSLFLVFMQCIGNCMFAVFLMLLSKQPPNRVPTLSYIKISFSYVGAMFSSNLALSYMSYPAQALAKSIKLIPVMLMRIIVLRHRYSMREYAQVALITCGICVFMFSSSQNKKVEKATTGLGLVLCIVSLILDGYTSPTQEKLNKQYQPSMAQMQFWLNFWAILMVGALLLQTGEFHAAIDFVNSYPSVIYESLLFGILSAMGQATILYTLLKFNSLVVVTITTTRKFFTILGSVIWYGHVLSQFQWIGVALVFVGLGLDIYHKYHDRGVHKAIHKQA